MIVDIRREISQKQIYKEGIPWWLEVIRGRGRFYDKIFIDTIGMGVNPIFSKIIMRVDSMLSKIIGVSEVFM